jgi:UDP-3-O-[3-hydroxymyristoyl] N-acetylglucosamine deacetylase/3-hydroxyacyl-[acyl-carrier-protein] dehydratase
MIEKQTTISTLVSISGVGLHTGKEVTITFKPAPANSGYRFKRVDIEGEPEIPADADLVTDVSRGTTLELHGVKVQTVEHTLAALVGLNIDNVLIELNESEPPILDGSSIQFINVLQSAGITELEAERQYFRIPETIRFYDPKKDVEIVATPFEDYRLTVMIDYKSPVLGTQHAQLHSIKEFTEEIASSRTFCFLHELEMLLKSNLIKGGDLSNAIVVVDRPIDQDELSKLSSVFNKENIQVRSEGILNNVELRHQNEPARHKLLDVVGDLALAGRPIKGHIFASKPGHSSNVEFAKMLKQMMRKHKSKSNVPHYNPNIKPLYDVNDIQNILPHRHPFVLVDKITEMSESHIIGVKSVSYNEPFFVGHFPGNPVMPGVLQIEAMAQTGGILCLMAMDEPSNYWTYFLKIENCKFKDKVVPGDTVVFRLDLIAPIRRGICQMRGAAYVGDRMVMEADLMAQLVKKSK